MPVRRHPPAVPCALAAAAFAVAAPAWAAPADAFSRGLEHGALYAVVAAFLGGLGTCLTPCVYPMIVITVAVFGAKKARGRVQAMGLSTAFVLGIVAMFTPMGLFAGLTGSVFGTLLGNRWVTIGLAAVFLGLAGAMLGAWEMVLPSRLTNRLAQVGGAGYGGAFLLGLASGIVAAPCTGPVLGGLLVWLGTTKSAALGGVAMLAYSLGLGLPFWIVGTFAIGLPKSGRWMVAVKSFFGIVMIVTALYFLKNAFPPIAAFVRPAPAFALGAGAAALAGIALGAVHVDWAESGGAGRARKAAGVVLAVAGLFALVGWAEKPPARALELAWEASEERGRERAAAEHRPMIVDFTAEWCGACGELARDTFTDPDVVAEASRFVTVRLDFTNEDDPRVKAAKDRYRIAGLPTVIAVDTAGVERVRITEFVPPARFLEAIRPVK